MGEQVRLAVLAYNHKLINGVCKKLCSTRPVEAKTFIELKDFLASLVDDPPDIVALSLNYPHKNIQQFPRLLKMSMNVPVIVFIESLTAKHQRMLQISPNEHKVKGVVTTQGLWEKISIIANFSDQVIELSTDHQQGLSPSLKPRQSEVFMMKGNGNEISSDDKASFISQLFKELNEAEDEGDLNSLCNTNLEEFEGVDVDESEQGSQSAMEDFLRKPRLYDGKENSEEEINEIATNETSEFLADSKQRVKLDELIQKSNNVEKIDEDFGGLSIEDQVSVDLKNKELKKEKKIRQASKQKSVLQEACEEVVRDLYEAREKESLEPVMTHVLSVFLVELNGIKGYLTFVTDKHETIEEHVLSGFRLGIIGYLKKKNAHCELSMDYPVVANLKDFAQVFSQFSEFMIKYESASGSKICVGFIEREVVLPKLEESEQDDMYLIDLKVIPPQTTVNFDAFMYLPINKKFVKYIKAGRLISLEQSKRHLHNENTKLYMPKSHKNKFIQFFIQNSINWEIALIQSQEEVA